MNGFRGTHSLQTGVDLDQIHGYQVARFVHTFTDEIALAQGQPATDWGSGAGGPLRIQRVHIKGEVDGSVSANVTESHFDDTTDSVSAD